MKMFKKYANLVLASALFVATVPAYSMEVTEANEPLAITEVVNVKPVAWYKNREIQQKLFIAACIATMMYVMARVGNKELAMAEAANVDPVVNSDVIGSIAQENNDIVAAHLNYMTLSFKEFGKKVALIIEQYDFDKCAVNPDMIGADELAGQYGHAVKQAIAQQYGSN